MDINQRATVIDSEVATPGYCACRLQNGNIRARLTLTEKVGIHQYLFNGDDDAYLLLDVSSTRLTKDKSRCLEAQVQILNDSTLQGYARYEGGWGGLNRYNTYFYAQFDRACLQKGIWNQGTIKERCRPQVCNGPHTIRLGTYTATVTFSGRGTLKRKRSKNKP